MTAQVISIKSESLNALINKTKAAWARADATKADADTWALRTGQYLVDLKQKAKEDGERWSDVLKRLGRSERRARELMELIGGEVTIGQQRERKRRSVRKVRANQKAALRSAGLDLSVDKIRRNGVAMLESEKEEREEEYAPLPTMEERLRISLANLCGDILAREPYFDKNFPGWRSVKLPSDIKTLVKEAVTAFASLAATVAAR